MADVGWIVLVDCGYSEWFETRDMRAYGPFGSEVAANEWATVQNDCEIEARDGEKVRAWPLEIVAVPELVKI